MKQFVLLMLVSLWSIGAVAENFMIGDVKYDVRTDSTVTLKDGKKATGDFVVPSKVVNPKTGKEYTVDAIASSAFKKSMITSIEIPSTVKTLGSLATFAQCPQLVSVKLPESITVIPWTCFEKCTALKSVDIDFRNIKEVEGYAFDKTPLGVCAPKYRLLIESTDFKDVYGFYLDEESVVTDLPLVISKDYNLGNSYFDENAFKKLTSNKTLIFEDPKAGGHAMLVLRRLEDFSRYVNYYSDYFSDDFGLGKLRDYLKKQIGDFNRYKYVEPEGKVYFGCDLTMDGFTLLNDSAYQIVDAAEKAVFNQRDKDFLEQLGHFVDAAIDEPDKLDYWFSAIDPRDVSRHDALVQQTIYNLCDNVYLVKPELSQAESKNLNSFANRCIGYLGLKMRFAETLLEGWAQMDHLNIEGDCEQHKEEYERILKLAERYMQTNEEPNPYMPAVQLAALCGLGRWKEAGSYFPKVHRGATENGKYPVPRELTYMQKEIQKRGFKAVTPTYAKKSSAKQSDNSDLIDFFVSGAIEAGVKHYEKKRAERKAREMFYESIGLDKKGRPKK